MLIVIDEEAKQEAIAKFHDNKSNGLLVKTLGRLIVRIIIVAENLYGEGGATDGHLHLFFLFLWPHSNHCIFYSWNHTVGR